MHFLYYKNPLFHSVHLCFLANPETVLDVDREAVSEKNQLPKWYPSCRVERQLRDSDADGPFQHDSSEQIRNFVRNDDALCG